MTWHHMSQPTKYLTSRHLKPNHLNSSNLATNHMTSYLTSHHHRRHARETQPASHHQHTTRRKGWRLARTKNLVWASHWLVALRAFYRQILSLAYRLGFFPWNFLLPGRGTAGILYIYIILLAKLRCLSCKLAMTPNVSRNYRRDSMISMHLTCGSSHSLTWVPL